MSEHQITYIELPSNGVSALKDFYGKAFGWTFQDYGSDYAAFTGAGLDGGLNGDPSHRTKAPLPVIQSRHIEAMLEQVQAAGGVITLPIFTYPGGRRFHFTDPSGNELAVFQPEP